MKPGLASITGFLRDAGNPQESYRTVHIAGTNGKGSTECMISRILEKAGYRTGLYTSPHLVRLTERISVDSKQPGRAVLERLAKKYYSLAKKHSLTFFEFITALAFIYFREQKVAVAVLETGLGGRFDATNVVKSPAVSVITDIDYDHTEILGASLSRIAGEKAGIIKPGCPVISGVENTAAKKVIERFAGKCGSELWEFKADFCSSASRTDWKKACQHFTYRDKKGAVRIELPLLGEYQVKNAALAAATARMLATEGFGIPGKAVRDGIGAVRWPGRFDVRRVRLSGKNKTVILDGAHNPGGIKMFSRSFKKSIWAKRPFDVIFGVLRDKNYTEIAKYIAGLGEKIILVPVRSERTLGTGSLKEVFNGLHLKNNVSVEGSLRKALVKTGNTVVVTGSLYLVGEALKIMEG